jgi:hypothetical protein
MRAAWNLVSIYGSCRARRDVVITSSISSIGTSLTNAFYQREVRLRRSTRPIEIRLRCLSLARMRPCRRRVGRLLSREGRTYYRDYARAEIDPQLGLRADARTVGRCPKITRNRSISWPSPTRAPGPAPKPRGRALGRLRCRNGNESPPRCVPRPLVCLMRGKPPHRVERGAPAW